VRVGPGRVDLRFQSSVLIELKASSRKAELDRSEGQLAGYAEHWREGPIFLLQCRPSEDFAQGEAERRYRRLRDAGHDVTVLITNHP
jgi:hypothetical protein